MTFADEWKASVRTFFQQTWLLLGNIMRSKIGAPRLTLMELFIPIYPALFFLLIKQVDAIPYQIVRVPEKPGFVASPLIEVSQPAVLTWIQDPSLLAFAPDNEQAQAAASMVCETLGVNFEGVQIFDSSESLTAAWHSDIAAGITFMLDEEQSLQSQSYSQSQSQLNGRIIVHHRNPIEQIVQFNERIRELEIFSATEAPSTDEAGSEPDNVIPPDPYTEEVMLTTGIALLQVVGIAAANSHLFPEDENSNSNSAYRNATAITILQQVQQLQVQQFPIPEREDIRDYLKYMFAVFFCAALFTSAQANMTTIGNEIQRAVRLQLRLKGLKRAPYWTAWMVAGSIIAILSGFVLVASLYATSTLNYTDPGRVILLFTLFTVAQTSFSLLVVSVFGERATGTKLFVTALILLFVTQGLFYAVQMLMIEGSSDASSIHATFLLYPVPFAHVMYSASTPELLQRSFSFDETPHIRMAYAMLFIDAVLYFVLTLSIDAIYDWLKQTPSAETSHSSRSSSNNNNNLSNNLNGRSDQQADLEEGQNHHVAAGIKVRNLVKEFDVSQGTFPCTKTVKLRAVDGLSFEVPKNQIFVVLGSNGAGKSTTLNLLTGATTPTSGDAWVHGMHVVKQRDELRQTLGVCPQFDVLYDSVTCIEQLVLFAKVAGMGQSEAREHAHHLLDELQLSSKANTLAGNLSGGQKRRLSLAIALIGTPSILLLDECTTGLDPSVRRCVWRLLQKLKTKITIAHTSHSMEEAEALADVIGIVSKGRLEAFGTTIEITAKYGNGYSLRAVRPASQTKGDDAERIKAVIDEHIRGATKRSDIGAEVSFSLPADQITNFPGLFTEIENRKEELGIDSFGVEQPSLEDAFLRVAATDTSTSAHSQAQAPANVNGERGDSAERNGAHGMELPEDPSMYRDQADPTRPIPAYRKFEPEFQCEKSVPRQIYAVLVQVIVQAVRSPAAVTYIVFFPVVMAIVAGAVSDALRPSDAKPENLQLQSRDYIDFYFSPTPPEPEIPLVSELLDPLISTKFTQVGTFNESIQFYDSLVQRQDEEIDLELNGAIAISAMNLTASLIEGVIMFNQTRANSLRVMLAQLQANVLNYYYYDTAESQGEANLNGSQVVYYVEFRNQLEQNNIASGGLTFFLAFSFSLLAAFYAEEATRVRVSRLKDMLLLGGLPRSLFWFSYLNAHFLLLLLSGIFSYGAMVAFGMSGVTENNALAYLLLLATFGPANVFFGYCLSFLFSSVQQAQSELGEPLQILLTVPWVIVTFALDEPSVTLENVLTVLIPGFGFYRGLAVLESAAVNENPFRSLSAIFAWDRYLIQVYLFLLVGGLLFIAILFLIETKTFHSQGGKGKGKGKGKSTRSRQSRLVTWTREALLCRKAHESHGDRRMVNEQEILHEIRANEDPRLPRPVDAMPRGYENVLEGLEDSSPASVASLALVTRNIRKSFHGGNGGGDRGEQAILHAVKGVSVGVQKNGIFGLLGFNGAGKSTFISSVTGMEGVDPDGGDAWIDGSSITTERDAARAKIGLCPQFDAILPLLSAREHLRMYCRIRGIPPHLTEDLCQHFIDMLDLRLKADSQAGKYSGGNKRKLSVALSMLSSTMVFLDEPSTGLDPGARRFLWEFLAGAKTDKGILLTTHSMEEADALSSHIAIMVAGAVRVHGTSQELKNKLGGLYTVTTRLVPGQGSANRVLAYLRTLYPATKVAAEDRTSSSSSSSSPSSSSLDHKDVDGLSDVDHLAIVKFKIPAAYDSSNPEAARASASLSGLFSTMNEASSRLGVLGFSVSQSSLEDAFLDLARMLDAPSPSPSSVPVPS